MNPLKVIIETEYLTSIREKSFWITTIALPIGMVLFGVVVGLLMEDSDAMSELGRVSSMQDDKPDFSGMQVYGMMMGMMLTLFLTMYGGIIFNKVKVEKANRIVEVLATCVTGRTMMLAKIISVGLIGLTQLFAWMLLIGILVGGVVLVFNPDIDFSLLLRADVWMGLIWGILFFIGGYVFYGSLFAAVGAMSDKNNENQEYVSVLTIVEMLSFYVGVFAVDRGTAAIAQFCAFFPFTAPTVATVEAVTGQFPVWKSLLSLVVLYGFAALSWIFAGKLYTVSMLLTGKKFSPKDILVFLRAK
ncbi:MAG: ABC transporter permease [Muribaculaceae bacterium]|nr:ABC transporter permease [Muribaculaceae bacterium]